MPKEKDDYPTDDRGRIRLYIGYWINGSGKRVQRPFYFGTNPSEVPSRKARVDELWDWTEKQHAIPSESAFQIKEPSPVTSKPVWTQEALGYADQLAKGEVQIVIPRTKGINPATPHHEGGEWVEDESSYASKLRFLAKRFPMIYFVPEEPEAASTGGKTIQQGIDRQIERLALVTPNILDATSLSLFKALDAYAQHIPNENTQPTSSGAVLTGTGVIRLECVERFKQHFKNVPLSSLDFDGCQSLIDYWRNRPLTRSKGRPSKPMSKSYCRHHIKELKRFFRWLRRKKQFGWKQPEDFDDLKWNVLDLDTERTNIYTIRQDIHSIDELKLLYEFGSDLDRLLFLLGLNCSFRGAEAGTLEEHHLFIDQPHPNTKYIKNVCKFDIQPTDRFILYARNKSQIYGEYLLWQETLAAVRWGLTRKQHICARLGITVPFVLVTKDGLPFYRRTSGNKNVSQIFSNKWNKLNKRIKKVFPEFRGLSFGQLRTTATDLVRHHSSGEVASVFEMHGSPTKDDLLDLYSNRPFGRVFQALKDVRETLAPVFDSTSNAFKSSDWDDE
ncbi:MAG: hypothetical protein JSS49_23750 [Planctomycetes bacterium]|nr:hypothetical protein [Planctomycetota bacterium]